MKLENQVIPMREDQYRLGCFTVENGKETFLCGENDSKAYENLTVSLSTEIAEERFHIHVQIEASGPFRCERLGMYFGIDCYMDRYPQWNEKFFPTALRCERAGFWGCFSSPCGVLLGVASPSPIVSWNHHYSRPWNDVGHRIYTASVDFINTGSQPERHPISPRELSGGDTLSYDFYLKIVHDKASLYTFVKDFAHIIVPDFQKFTLEPGEKPVLLTESSSEFAAQVQRTDTREPDSRIFISKPGYAETTLYVRKDWFYYLDCARKSAEICQQKPGTNSESWYGYFSRILYAKQLKDPVYLKALEKQFNQFFYIIISSRTKTLKKKAYPHRLQNASTMISLLADFYEATGKRDYLDRAHDVAAWLMKLQAHDGSYRSHGTHYTCVIYPAKSMLELALAEKDAGLHNRSRMHYDSAQRAIENLYSLMDNIETEGEMTFEDGMISCEALQLGYLALLSENEADRKRLAGAAAAILQKHQCLQQRLIPDSRIRGATMRYWEARYDINFGINMLNSPHGWTSWKTYATYYLYLLTQEVCYLTDTMDTLGACMQCIDENGVLRWAFVPNPCASGRQMVKAENTHGFTFVHRTVSEAYLPMISDWYRQNPKKLRLQYIRYIHKERTCRTDRGGSCDNDVHEHFKCLEETVFGKAFIHFSDDQAPVLYNCRLDGNTYQSSDPFVKTWIVRAAQAGEISIFGQSYPLHPGINILETQESQSSQ